MTPQHHPPTPSGPGDQGKRDRQAELDARSTSASELDSESAPMLTTAQREELRRTLEAKRVALLRALRAHEDRDEEPGDDPLEKEPADPADLAESAIEDHDRIAMADHNLELLEEVDHALTRMDAGTYGLSEASGEPIPYERLRAVPWARYSAEEAERAERASRGASDR
jgi:DnaK suppressor protein